MRVLTVCCLLLLGHLVQPAPAADLKRLIDEVVQDIPPEDLAESGSEVLAERLAELLEAAGDLGLDAQQALELRLRLGEAWLDAGKPEPAEALLREVLAAGPGEALQRRAGLALVAVWELGLQAAEKPDEHPDPVEALEALGEFDAQVIGRALTLRGMHRAILAPVEALESYQEALEVLADEDPRSRVPVYALMVVAKERAGEAPDAIMAWLEQRIADPAVAHVVHDVVAAGDQMIGQPAPLLVARRVDGEAGDWDLTAQQGRPILVYFFATWCGPCAKSTPAVVRIAKDHPGLTVVGVSLDTKDSLPNIPAYRQRHGVTYPLIGDALGWDGELDDAWYVGGIPALYLVDAAGRVAAKDLVQDEVDTTVAAIEAALEALDGAAAPPPMLDDLEAPIP